MKKFNDFFVCKLNIKHVYFDQNLNYNFFKLILNNFNAFTYLIYLKLIFIITILN